ncbi:MAG: hypothetical protein ACRDM9_02210, partial [Gaiellaceae bacterium]
SSPAVPLFQRSTSELPLRQHLERLGVSEAWLPSAEAAIRHCERGEYFEPVFSVAGPAPARSVVALMRLEPFVAAEIDWSVSPSESPFWVGAVGDLKDEAFRDAADRFLELFAFERNPTSEGELDRALRSMVAAVEASVSASGEDSLEAAALTGVWSLGSGGYVWRLAESAVESGDLNLRADLEREVEAVVASAPEESLPPDRLLAWAAAECTRRNLLLGSGSPGGWATGGEFLRRGFRFVREHVVPEDARIPAKDCWYAFSFGVALYEVDDGLRRRSGASPPQTQTTSVRARRS